MKKRTFENGTLFYDPSEDRYIKTTDSPHKYSDSVACDVTEWDYENDRQIEYSQHFTWGELCSFELCGR